MLHMGAGHLAALCVEHATYKHMFIQTCVNIKFLQNRHTKELFCIAETIATFSGN